MTFNLALSSVPHVSESIIKSNFINYNSLFSSFLGVLCTFIQVISYKYLNFIRTFFVYLMNGEMILDYSVVHAKACIIHA